MADACPEVRGLEVVRPLLAPLHPDEIRTLLRRYPEAGVLRAVLAVSKRPYSAGSLVRTDRRDLFVKKWPMWRTVEDLQRQHALTAHLISRGFPTPALLQNEDGATITAGDGGLYEVFERANGTDVYRHAHSWTPLAGEQHAFAAGRRLAEFHEAVRDAPLIPSPPDRPMVARFDVMRSADLMAGVAAEVRRRPALAAYLQQQPWRRAVEELYGPFHARVHPLLVRTPSWVTHGDWHGNNLFFRGDEVSAVIDFHLCDVTLRMYDLAVALDRNAIQWLAILDGEREGAVRYDLMAALLRGYTSVIRLTSEEQRLLPDLLAVHRLDLALSNIDYYLAVEGAPGRADWAYQVYLIGHLRELSSPWGQALLDFVGECVA